MKTRMGFVSNSSTTSFCIYGVELKCNKNTYESIIKKEKKEIPLEPGCSHKFDRAKCRFCPECGEVAWQKIEEEEDDYRYDLTEHFEKLGLDCDDGFCEEDKMYVGVNIKDSQPKDMTLEKLGEAREKLQKMFPKLKPTFYCGVSEG